MIKEVTIATIVLPKREVSKVFFHCSASDNPKHDNPQTIEEWHLARGFKGIGYHYFVDKSARLFACRDIERDPAAQEGHNKGSLAICFSGLAKFEQKQMVACLAFVRKIHKLDPSITFHGHCEVSNKTCPVFDYKKLLKLDSQGRFNEVV